MERTTWTSKKCESLADAGRTYCYSIWNGRNIVGGTDCCYSIWNGRNTVGRTDCQGFSDTMRLE